MIHIYIYAHGSVIDDEITFIETDMKVASIEDDFLIQEDFDKLWLTVEEVDTVGLISEKWYTIGLQRVLDFTGPMIQDRFELAESPVIVNV